MITHSPRGGFRLALLVAISIILSAAPLHAITRHVDSSAISGGNNGTSWANAYIDLQSALAVAASGDEIWVAEGIYKPSSPGNRSATFQMVDGVAIYGGFPSGGGDFVDRAPSARPTILSGDLAGNDGPEFANLENSFHVVNGTGVSATAILDGFTIKGGTANAVGPASTGGGIIIDGSGSPTIANCYLLGNYASEAGGAIYSFLASPVFTNCSFEANSCAKTGGAIHTSDGDLTLTNCAFQGNAATETGGALHSFRSSIILTNCSFQGNAATLDGGAIYNELTALELANCIIWNNAANGITTTASPSIFNVQGAGSIAPVYSHCLIHHIDLSPSGTNSFNGDNPGNAPQFALNVDPLTAPSTGGNLHLKSNSPMIGQGNDVANTEPTDLDGNPRLIPFGIELGAYEFQQLTFNPKDIVTTVPKGNEYSKANWLAALDGLTVVFTLKNSTGSIAFDSFPVVDQNGTLRFTLAAHTAGIASFDVQLIDPSSNTASSEIRTISITAKTIHYVDASANGTNNGSKWANAYKHLQNALSAASSGDEIFVARGTYYPDTTTNSDTDNRSTTFRLKNGVTIYGGFPIGGGNGTFGVRNPGSQPTILSGDIDGDDGPNFTNNSGNAIHVVTGIGVNATAVLDGFTITAGNSSSGDGAGLINSGGSPTVNNCLFEANSASSDGGAIYNNNASSPAINNCVFRGNTAENGGAVYNGNSSKPDFINCSFEGNSASNQGGAIYNNNNSSPVVTNCSFQGNAADEGGAFYNRNFSKPALTNGSFQGNSAASNGGALFNANSSSPPLTNCILWNNAANGVTNTPSASVFNSGSTPIYSHCLVHNLDLSSSGTNNFDGSDTANDPIFAREVDSLAAPVTGGDLRLRLDTSPMIGAGDSSANLTPLDLANKPRIQNLSIDLGAYEGFLFRELRMPSDTANNPVETNTPWTTNELTAAGSYAGLLTGVSGAPEGSISAKLTSRGVLSGSINYLGLRLNYRGAIAGDGSFSVMLTDRRSERNFDVALQLVSTPNGFRLVGTVTEGGTVLTASLDQAAFNGINNPAPYFGTYTVLIPPNPDFDDSTTHPQGAGWARLSVAKNGRVRLAGQLGDLTPLSVSAVVSEDGTLQLFKALYRTSPRGSVAGTVTFRDTPTVSDLDGTLSWRKYLDVREKLYPDGFDFPVTLIGSAYTRPFFDEPLLPGIDLSETENAFWGAGPDIVPLSWNAKNKIVGTTNPGEKFNVLAAAASGVIRGNYQNITAGKRFSFKGVAFQKQDIIAGNFSDNDASNLFTIAPQGLPSLQIFDQLTDTEVMQDSSVDLGDSGTLFGAIAERNLVVENNGDSPLLINSITVEEGTAFAVVTQAGKIIEAHGSSIVTVQFQPTEAGSASATITLTSNSRKESPFNFEVTGNGIAGSSADGSRPAQDGWAGETPDVRSLPLSTTAIASGTFDPLAHAGSFQGVVSSKAAGLPIAGIASIRISNDTFSGTVVIDGVIHRLKGLFDADGAAIGISRPAGLDFSLAIHTVSDIRGDSGVKIIGDIGAYSIELVRSGFSTEFPAPFTNRYTVILPSVIDLGDGFPAGDGYGTVVINALGKTRASLVLGDGTRTSHAGTVSVDGEWLLYKSLYSTIPRGFLAGTIHFRETVGVSDFDSVLHWVSPPNPTARRFGRGFSIRQPLIGAVYTPPAAGERALPGLAESVDNTLVYGSSPGIPDLGLPATWDTANKVHYVPTANEKLIVRISTQTGIVTGAYIDRANGHILRFRGAILQIQQLAAGNHLTPSGSESITLTPAVDP